MLIKQVVEFELSELGPLVARVLLYNWLFSEQSKNLYGKSSSGLLFTAKILTRQYTAPSFSLPGPNYLQNLVPKCKIFKVFWTWIVSRKRIEQLYFLIGL